MKITGIRTTPFTLPLATPIGFAHGAMADTKHVLIEVDTDEGVTGVGEAISRPYFYGESQRSIVAAVEEWFAPMLTGRDPVETGSLWTVLDQIEHNNTLKGALDIALHDIKAKSLGVPCHRMLGGGDGKVRVTYVCGYSSPEGMAAETAQINASYGINAFKLKTGVEKHRDADTIRLVREALPDALIYIDCNEAFNRQGAMDLLEVCASHRVSWAEEPCSRRDRASRELVGTAGIIPILGDESCRTIDDVLREINDRTLHMVSIKVARTGFERSRDILGLCLANSILPMVGSQGDSGIGVLAGGHFCTAFPQTRALPAELSFHLNLAGELLVEPPVIRAGMLELSSSPGLGGEIDRKALARFKVS